MEVKISIDEVEDKWRKVFQILGQSLRKYESIDKSHRSFIQNSNPGREKKKIEEHISHSNIFSRYISYGNRNKSKKGGDKQKGE